MGKSTGKKCKTTSHQRLSSDHEIDRQDQGDGDGGQGNIIHQRLLPSSIARLELIVLIEDSGSYQSDTHFNYNLGRLLNGETRRYH